MDAVQIAQRLREAVADFSFGPPVTHVYNPLEYAWRTHKTYLERFGSGKREAILLGMNPGPWGMAQTGVPFGDVCMVRDWMGISGEVGKPPLEHPKRPIQGFHCAKSEVSGTRLWGWARDTYGAPEHFFARFYVHNYCPLVFMTASGANFTPDKLAANEQAPLFGACDTALRELVECTQPAFLIGVGAFAEQRIRAALPGYRGVIGRILHPSPASPAANRGWAEAAAKGLKALGMAG